MLKQTQAEIIEWSTRNFGECPNSTIPLRISSFLGMVEEIGELAHHVLKMGQNIRGSREVHLAGVVDSIADLLVFTLDFCARNGMDAEDILSEVWSKVKQRDWKKDSVRGGEG